MGKRPNVAHRQGGSSNAHNIGTFDLTRTPNTNFLFAEVGSVLLDSGTDGLDHDIPQGHAEIPCFGVARREATPRHGRLLPRLE